MTKVLIASFAAMMLLMASAPAQAEQLYRRLPNGQFVRVVQMPAHQPVFVPRYVQPPVRMTPVNDVIYWNQSPPHRHHRHGDCDWRR